VDKAYDEINKGKDVSPVVTGSPCPACGQPVQIADAWDSELDEPTS